MVRTEATTLIQIPTDNPEPTLIAFVRTWFKLIAAGQWEEACGMIDEPNHYGDLWTPEEIQKIIEVT